MAATTERALNTALYDVGSAAFRADIASMHHETQYITRSNLLVINKIDIAPDVGASLEIMDRDAKRMRDARSFIFTNLRAGEGVTEIAQFIAEKGGLGTA